MGFGHSHGEELLEFSAKKPSKVKSLDPDAQIHIDGTDGGSFGRIVKWKVSAQNQLKSPGTTQLGAGLQKSLEISI